jgi:hypothetical protein
MNEQLNLAHITAADSVTAPATVAPERAPYKIADLLATAGDDDDQQFEWCDNDAVVLQEQPPTAVYINPFGAVVIRQQSMVGDDPCLLFRPEHIPTLIARLLQAAKAAR